VHSYLPLIVGTSVLRKAAGHEGSTAGPGKLAVPAELELARVGGRVAVPAAFGLERVAIASARMGALPSPTSASSLSGGACVSADGGKLVNPRMADLARVVGWGVVRSHGGGELARGRLRQRGGGRLAVPQRMVLEGVGGWVAVPPDDT
jgi:hypothetical protein